MDANRERFAASPEGAVISRYEFPADGTGGPFQGTVNLVEIPGADAVIGDLLSAGLVLIAGGLVE